MTRITLTAMAVLAATAMAFAGDHHDGGGSGHYGSDDWQQPFVKSTTTTASIKKPVQPVQEPVRPGSDRHRAGNR